MNILKKDNHMPSVKVSGMKSSLIDKIFKYYLYFCLAWVTFAICFDFYMIVKHFNEFGFN